MAKRRENQADLDRKRDARLFREFRNLSDDRIIAFLLVAIHYAASEGVSSDEATISVIRRVGKKASVKIALELTLPKSLDREWQEATEE